MNGKIVAQNRKAFHDYFIEENFEAGIQLTGTEIKSIRQGKANLKDSFIRIKDNEAFLCNCHIAEYDHGNRFNHDPTRTRKLLLHKREILKLSLKTRDGGYTIVPLKIYLHSGLAKVEIAIAKGKKLYDKRHDLKEKDAKREMEKIAKNIY